MADNGSFWIIVGLGGLAFATYAKSNKKHRPKPTYHQGPYGDPVLASETALAGACYLRGDYNACRQFAYRHDLNAQAHMTIQK